MLSASDTEEATRKEILREVEAERTPPIEIPGFSKRELHSIWSQAEMSYFAQRKKLLNFFEVS